MFSRKLIAGAAGLFLIAGATAGAMSASASGPGAGACAVTGGSVSLDPTSPGIQLQTANNNTFKFVGLTIACGAADTDDLGSWTIEASGHTDAETCASGSGAGTIDGGTSPGDGAVTGGSYTFTRVGPVVQVDGTIVADETHSFHAAFVFTPTDGECSGDLSQPTKHATLTGTAAVSEGLPA